MRVAFHENDENHENEKKGLRQLQTRSWLSPGLAEITEPTEMTKTMGIWDANYVFPKQRVWKYRREGRNTSCHRV